MKKKERQRIKRATKLIIAAAFLSLGMTSAYAGQTNIMDVTPVSSGSYTVNSTAPAGTGDYYWGTGEDNALTNSGAALTLSGYNPGENYNKYTQTGGTLKLTNNSIISLMTNSIISGGTVTVDNGSTISAGAGMIGAEVTFENNGTYALVGNNSATVNGSGITSIVQGVINNGTINQNITIDAEYGKLTTNAGSIGKAGSVTITNSGDAGGVEGLVFIGGTESDRVIQANVVRNSISETDTTKGIVNFGNGTDAAFISNTGNITQHTINIATYADVDNTGKFTASKLNNSGVLTTSIDDLDIGYGNITNVGTLNLAGGTTDDPAELVSLISSETFPVVGEINFVSGNTILNAPLSPNPLQIIQGNMTIAEGASLTTKANALSIVNGIKNDGTLTFIGGTDDNRASQPNTIRNSISETDTTKGTVNFGNGTDAAFISNTGNITQNVVNINGGEGDACADVTNSAIILANTINNKGQFSNNAAGILGGSDSRIEAFNNTGDGEENFGHFNNFGSIYINVLNNDIDSDMFENFNLMDVTTFNNSKNFNNFVDGTTGTLLAETINNRGTKDASGIVTNAIIYNEGGTIGTSDNRITTFNNLEFGRVNVGEESYIYAVTVNNKGTAEFKNDGSVLATTINNKSGASIVNNGNIGSEETAISNFVNESTGKVEGAGTLYLKDGSNAGTIAQNTISVTNNTSFTNAGLMSATTKLNNEGTIINSGNDYVTSPAIIAVTNGDRTTDPIIHGDAILTNTKNISSTNGIIFVDRLKNDGNNATISLNNSALFVDNQTIEDGDIGGNINVIGGNSTLAINGKYDSANPDNFTQDFVGNLNIGGIDNAILNFISGYVDENAKVNLAAGSTLNITGTAVDTTNDRSQAVVDLSSSDIWNGAINLKKESGSPDNERYGLALTGVTKTIGNGTATYEQTGGSLELSEGTKFTMLDSSKIQGGNVAIDETSQYISGSNGFTVDNLINLGTINAINNGTEEYKANTVVLGNGTSKFYIDIKARCNDGQFSNDTFGSDSGIIAASVDKTATADIAGVFLGNDIFGYDAPIDRNYELKVLKGSIAEENTIDFTTSAPEVLTPIGYYKLSGGGINNPNLSFNLTRYNPQVFRGQMTTIAQWQNQLAIDDMLFTHSMVLPSFKENDTLGMANQYAAVNPMYAPYQYSRKDGGLWVKMYGNFENLQTNIESKMGNNAWGTLIGADFGLKDLAHGWKFMPTAYIGYNGAHQTSGSWGAYQNGGQAGFMGTFYKNNVILSGLAYGGVYDNEIDIANQHDSAFNYFAGASAKAAYNWRFHRDWVLQPNLMIAYNFFGQQNWHSDFGQMGMSSGMLNGINLAPGLNLIWEKDTFSAYLTVQYMYNLNGAVGGRAGHVNLPQVMMDRGYIQYGFGVNKKFTDRASGYFQTVLRNVGRTGVGFQAGFNYKIGKAPSNTALNGTTTKLAETKVDLKSTK